MTDQQLQQYRDSIVSRWLDAQKAGMKISSKVEPTPTPAVSSFVPPPDAPPLPTPTTVPEASPVLARGRPSAYARRCVAGGFTDRVAIRQSHRVRRLHRRRNK